MARREHDRWVAERLEGGWRFVPGSKDVTGRTSPHLVGWERLSEEMREYNRNAVRLIPAVLAKADFEVRRRRPAPAVDGQAPCATAESILSDGT